jgi:hypothetical protein
MQTTAVAFSAPVARTVGERTIAGASTARCALHAPDLQRGRLKLTPPPSPPPPAPPPRSRPRDPVCW